MVRVMNPIPGTPAAPMEASVAVITTVTSSRTPSWIPYTWAMNTVLTP
jgi:hypothetical protein